MSKSIRLRTTPGVDKNIQIKIEQDFDFLEILSLKISQQDLYTSFCADYGVVVGRVIANGGFGVPNAKVSVFIPITSDDEKNSLIKDLYPYKTVTSKKDGIRYNLLLSKETCSLNKPVGTFPTKEEVLNNDIMIEIFDKYYRYTTKTNQSGDYMIFGVPTGQQTVHMDVDMSDAGPFSSRPYDFIDNGYSEKLFESRLEFKESSDLDSLPQIKSGDKGIDVVPFWGDDEQCIVGITRVDFDTNFNFSPTAVLTGSVFSDKEKNSINKRCNPKNDQGEHCELRTGNGTLETLRVSEYSYDNTLTQIQPLTLESYILPQGMDSIDENGTFVVTVPMNVGHVVTNEFGDMIPSVNPEVGIPTKGMYRFKMKLDEPPTNRKRKTATLLFPALNRATGGESVNLNGKPSTENARWTEDITAWIDNGVLTDTFYKDFHMFEWNQLYTISQYIPKYKKGSNRFSYLGLKNVDACDDKLAMPYNGAMFKGGTLFGLLSAFIRLRAWFLRFIVVLTNLRICIQVHFGFLGIDVCLLNINLTPFGFVGNGGSTVLECESGSASPWNVTYNCHPPTTCGDCSTTTFSFQVPNETNCSSIAMINDWKDCAIYDLAREKSVIRLTFYDAWLTGSAYLYQFKYKSRVKNGNTGGTVKDKFCGPGGDKLGSDEYMDNPPCCTTRGVPNDPLISPADGVGSCEKCLVRGPNIVDVNPSNSQYHNNTYETGASDINDFIYCPETTPTKIVNLGRMDMCEDIVTQINRCLNSTSCSINPFVHSQHPADFVQSNGTHYEQGHDTEQWSNKLDSSSYGNLDDVFIYHLGNYNGSVRQMFKGQGGCDEYELETFIWKDVSQISKIQTEIILRDDDGNEDLWVPNSHNVFTQYDSDGYNNPIQVGFETDNALSTKFNPWVASDPWLAYGAGNSGGLNSHFRNTPYFYFGLHEGKTAMDRLRKEYIIRD